MPKKTGAEMKAYVNSTLLTTAPTGTTFPSGFTNEIAGIRDNNKGTEQTTIDFGTRADPKEKRIQDDGITFTFSMFHDPADADYVIFADAAAGKTPVAVAFTDGASGVPPLIVDVANWNIKETGRNEALREGVLTTFEASVHSFYARIKVPAA